ncbi:MAG: hypothetical protein LH471_04060 [Salinibacterium sp.]|nr:hypothetical protein [Salinibacterium sp.]
MNTPTDPIAAAAALSEIDRIVHALHDLVNGPDRAEMSHRAYAYVSKTTWWIASLDEQFRDENKGGAYVAARDKDEFGMLIPGILWIRDRISHQLPYTVAQDDRSFFDPKPGGKFHISSAYEWLPIDQIRDGGDKWDRAEWKEIYQKHFEGRGIVSGPARIAEFLRKLLEQDAACKAELERIISVE